MGQVAIQMMNLLHSVQSSNRPLLPNPNPMSMNLQLPSLDKEDGAFPERWPFSVKKSLRCKIIVNFQLLALPTETVEPFLSAAD